MNVVDNTTQEVSSGGEKAQTFRLQDVPRWESSKEEEKKEKGVPMTRVIPPSPALRPAQTLVRLVRRASLGPAYQA